MEYASTVWSPYTNIQNQVLKNWKLYRSLLFSQTMITQAAFLVF